MAVLRVIDSRTPGGTDAIGLISAGRPANGFASARDRPAFRYRASARCRFPARRGSTDLRGLPTQGVVASVATHRFVV
jgi:hypothetical protein